MIPVKTLLRESRYLPHRIDLGERSLWFLDTSRDRLAAASFLDGRTPLSDMPVIVAPLDDALAAAPIVGGTDRLVCHVSFCGSTLLARLLDVPGRSFSYKEPQVLVDLADAHSGGGAGERLGPALSLVLGQLRLGWTGGEATVVKPSNWVNTLLPTIVRASPGLKLALIDMDARDFLVAVFRGGRDRIAFTLRVGARMQLAFPRAAATFAAATGGGDPLLDAARLCLVVLHGQRAIFDMVDPARVARLHQREIVVDPAAALDRAAELLDLDLSAGERAASVAAHARAHAKGPERAFDPGARAVEDDAVERLHGARMDAALRWADERLAGALLT